jgi:hypothetical protein
MKERTAARCAFYFSLIRVGLRQSAAMPSWAFPCRRITVAGMRSKQLPLPEKMGTGRTKLSISGRVTPLTLGVLSLS